ncbi:hypothetical protein GGR56DRAFT_659188 [Xylariaceae sp. FL0804]|nr:hypothetical protein GGR56DRAFT_659188 [Xylariaceae sp. FL0804]
MDKPAARPHPDSHHQSRRPATVPPRFAFSPLSQPTPNPSSTSLVPSTAEGRPIPLDGSTAAHRTTALRELSRAQPSSRAACPAKSAGPPGSTSTTTGTYSHPVLVRTYSGPPPASSAGVRSAGRRAPVPSASAAPSASSASSWQLRRDGLAVSMSRQGANRKPPSTKLPPLEAFTLKSIMAETPDRLSADLDRVAEICARSRYSLSNQYEVHVAPHGSGATFLAPAVTSAAPNSTAGPTLQAIADDDEQGRVTRRKRASTARRRSAAQGTLETIMSSSRSSDEDKGKKKSAAELAAEVRGRAASAGQDESGSANSTEAQASSEQPAGRPATAIRAASKVVTPAAATSSHEHHVPEDNHLPEPQTSSRGTPARRAEGGKKLKHLNVGVECRPDPPRPVLSTLVAAAFITGPGGPLQEVDVLPSILPWLPERYKNTREISNKENTFKGYLINKLKRSLY